MHYYSKPTAVIILTEYSLAILCRSLSCNITEYSACLVGYSFIIRSITSSLRSAVSPEIRENNPLLYQAH